MLDKCYALQFLYIIFRKKQCTLSRKVDQYQQKEKKVQRYLSRRVDQVSSERKKYNTVLRKKPSSERTTQKDALQNEIHPQKLLLYV